MQDQNKRPRSLTIHDLVSALFPKYSELGHALPDFDSMLAWAYQSKDMKVHEIMDRTVRKLRPHDSIFKAGAAMISQNKSWLPVDIF